MLLLFLAMSNGSVHGEAMIPDAMNSQFLVASITINNQSIFDLDNAEEDGTLYRLANKLHVSTRPQVIEQQLLFAVGDLASPQAVSESERILRENGYIQDAEIELVRRSSEVVDVNVNTSDTWTLLPKISFSHAGGASSTGLGLKESNLLGTGIAVEVLYESDVDRDTRKFKFIDRQLGTSWYGIRAISEDNSDGHLRVLEIGKPFYSLDTRSSHGFAHVDEDRTDSLYDRGEIAAQYQHIIKGHELLTGWSKGLRNGWARRYTAGLGYNEHQFSDAIDAQGWTAIVPEDRKHVYPFVGIEYVQDEFEESTNFDQIGIKEDRFVGTSFSARVGAARKEFGSTSDAWLLSAAARTSISKSKSSSLHFGAELNSRVEDGDAANFLLDLNARYYKRLSKKRLLFASFDGLYGHNLDIDQQVYLGGDNGLRGYPLRYQAGDKSALLTFEQRFYTDWYPFRLFRVGAAVFFDMGRTWGEGPLNTGNDGWLKDVGAGLRLGNTRSSMGRVVHIDVAYPLDADRNISNVQFLVELKQSF